MGRNGGGGKGRKEGSRKGRGRGRKGMVRGWGRRRWEGRIKTAFLLIRGLQKL